MTLKPRHRRKIDDPLVPISGVRVRALLRRAEMSEHQAARALRARGISVAQSTLDHIAQGHQVRCRASVRDGLASLHHPPVPAEWLAGPIYGPRLRGSGRDLNQRATPASAIGRRIAALRETAELAPSGGLLDRSVGDTPFYELVAYRLVHDLTQAARRRVSPIDVEDMGRLVRQLLSLDTLRRWLFVGPASETVSSEELDLFAGAMGEAARIVIRPWLERKKIAIRRERVVELQAALDHAQGDVTLDTTPRGGRSGAINNEAERDATHATSETTVAPGGDKSLD